MGSPCKYPAKEVDIELATNKAKMTVVDIQKGPYNSKLFPTKSKKLLVGKTEFVSLFATWSVSTSKYCL